MSKADLHVHSRFSNQPSEWVLRNLGMQECYIEVEDIYRNAKKRGMDYVTVTDHNEIKGSQILKDRYPDDVFTGSEITAVFPENRCKVHILVYDIAQAQFDHIKQLRWDIYRLRNYIKNENIAHSVAHATCNVNGSLTVEMVEKLILLFDVFEGINGARNYHFNHSWTQVLNYLTPRDIERLYKKYYIDPFSENPWIKGFTGGTDDHAGIFVGRTFTKDDGVTKEDFISNLKKKTTAASGLSSDFKTRVFGFYKIQNDWKKNIPAAKQSMRKGIISDIVFDHNHARLSLKKWLFLVSAGLAKDVKKRLFVQYIHKLRKDLKNVAPRDIDKRIDITYRHSIIALDEYILSLVRKYSQNPNPQATLNFTKIMGDIGVILNQSLPLFVTYKFINLNNLITQDLEERYLNKHYTKRKKRVLWFTDTINDLNGVSLIVREFLKQSKTYNFDIKVVCSLAEKDFHATGLAGINLPPLTQHVSELYKSYTMHIPSLLRSIEKVQNANPDEIIISTPGPVGLIGLLSAKLLGIKSSGIYHTDFTKQMERIVGHGIVPTLFEKYLRWFYGNVNLIKVPTRFYMKTLQERGYIQKPMSLFNRGVNIHEFKHTTTSKYLLRHDGIFKDGFNLLYVGRISKDKNLKFLSIVYKKLLVNYPQLNLILVGDGPQKPHIQKYFDGCKRVVFVPKVDRFELTFFYSLADLFVFPSTTDTFGMVVLEAQACNLPVCVMNSCGSKELVRNGQTGYVLPEDVKQWVKNISHVIWLKDNDKQKYMKMKNAARSLVIERHHWKRAFESLLHHQDPSAYGDHEMDIDKILN